MTWQAVSLYRPYRDTRTTVEQAILPSLRHTFATPESFARLRQKVEEVCRGLEDKDYASEGLAWHNFVCARVRYMRDPVQVELVKAPDQILREIEMHGIAQEDCEAIASFECAGHDCIGAPSRIVTCSFMRGPRPANIPLHLRWPLHTHAFAQFQDPRTQRWVTTDPVAGARTPDMLRRISAFALYPVG